MGGFDRKLKRQAARSVMKENNIPKHLISKKVKQYTKMDNSTTIENEKKSINYVSIMHLLKMHFFANYNFENSLDESELKDDYYKIKKVVYLDNKMYNKIVASLTEVDVYKNSLLLAVNRNNAYFGLLKKFDVNLQLVLLFWMCDKLLSEPSCIFNKAMYDSNALTRLEAHDIVSSITSLLGMDSDTEITVKAYMDKLVNLEGLNYSKNLSITLAKRHNAYILDVIQKLGLKKEEDKIISYASELYARALEVANTTKLFEEIYTIDISANSLFMASYYLSILSTLSEKNKNLMKPKLLALLKSNSSISDDELSIVNSLMNHSANDNSMFYNKEVFYTMDKLIIMIFIVSLMSLPLRVEILNFVLSQMFSSNLSIAMIKKDIFVKDVMLKFKDCVDNISNLYNDESNLINKTYFYTYKLEIDFIVESIKVMKEEDFDEMLREQKIYKKYKTLIEF